MKTQLTASESVKRQLQQDLGRSRRENQALKAFTRQTKLVNDRSIARQRERFADAAILAARNGCSRLVVVPGVFPAKGSSSSQDSSSSLYRQQISELETQRSSTLASNSAMRRLCTESINALGEASAALSGDSALRSLQSDLFPSGRPLRKDYTLAAHSSAHPAVRALSMAIAANEKALFTWEGERKALKDNASPPVEQAASEEGEQLHKSTGSRPKATRIPLRSTSASAKPVIDFSDSDTQEHLATEMHKLQTQLRDREADIKKMEDRLEEREQEMEEVRQRAEAAERRETEAVQLAREEAARLLAERQSHSVNKEEEAAEEASIAEQLAEADFDSQAEAERTANSEMSYVVESVGPKSSARRTQSYQPTYEVPVQRLLSAELKRSRDEVDSEEAEETKDVDADVNAEGRAEQDASSEPLASPPFAVDELQAAPLPPPIESARTEDGARRPRKTNMESNSSSSSNGAAATSSTTKRQRLSGAEPTPRPALSSRGVPNQRSVSSSSSASSSAHAPPKESTPQPSSLPSSLPPPLPMASTPAAPAPTAGKKRAANPSVLQAALERRRRAAAAAAGAAGEGASK